MDAMHALYDKYRGIEEHELVTTQKEMVTSIHHRKCNTVIRVLDN